MRLRISIRFLLLGAVLGLAGCYHKDIDTDRADDVAGNLLYINGSDSLILSKEEIFQANSKSSENGVTHISGYTELRLTSYDLRTGEVVGRAALGEMQEEACELIGTTPGKVWMFGLNDDLGLHYRDPKTLEPIATWSDLKQKPGLASFQPAKPEWPQLGRHYAMDPRSGKLFVTDQSGFHYLPFGADPRKVGSVAIIDYTTNTLVKSLYTGYQPHGIVVDEESGIAIVAHRNISTDGPAPHHSSNCGGRNGYLRAIDLNTLELVPGFKVEMVTDPYSIAVKR